MNTTSLIKSYNLVWQVKDAPNYQFTQNGECVNTQRGKEIKQVLIGYTLGFCIKGKFQSLANLRKRLVKVETTNCQF